MVGSIEWSCAAHDECSISSAPAPGTLAELPPADDDWYLNLLWVDGKKYLLLTHTGTLFSIFLTGIRKADLKPLGPYLTDAIEAELRSELLPVDILGPLDAATVHVAKTASRSTLSFMNDMTYHLRYQVDAAGGLDHCDVPAINHRLQRTLHNRDGYRPTARPRRRTTPRHRSRIEQAACLPGSTHRQQFE